MVAKQILYVTQRVTGADTQTRTGDLILTKDALYHLSYISKLIGGLKKPAV